MKLEWKVVWKKQFKVSKRFVAKQKYSTFQITKFISSEGDILYFTSTSPKKTCGTSHSTFGHAYQFGNKGYYSI